MKRLKPKKESPKVVKHGGPRRSLGSVDIGRDDLAYVTRDDLTRRTSENFLGFSGHDHQQLEVIRHKLPPDLALLASSFRAEEATTPPRSIGEQIRQYRKDCRWTQDDLAEKTGIDKKTIVSHELDRTKKMRYKTRGEYEQAFTKKLNRSIILKDS